MERQSRTGSVSGREAGPRPAPSSSCAVATQGPSTGRPAAVTALLGRAAHGDPAATDELFPLVYEELRRLADRLLSAEPRGQTLQATALVHEAYLRLVGPADGNWQNRAHFFGAASRAIRRILIDRARARLRTKRGGGERPLPLDDAESPGIAGPGPDVLDVDDALHRLEAIDPQKAHLVELRFFGGRSVDEAAEALGGSPAPAARDWRFARAWLHRELSGGAP